jgi:hypothetical protein
MNLGMNKGEAVVARADARIYLLQNDQGCFGSFMPQCSKRSNGKGRPAIRDLGSPVNTLR